MTEMVEPTPTVRRRLRPWILAVGIVGLLVVVAVIVAVFLAVTGPSKFEAAVEECKLTNSQHVSLGDSGATLELNGEGTSGSGEGSGLSSSNLACVLSELDVTDAVIASMDSTRALDGRVTGSWDGIDAVWSYHPDQGLDIILTMK